MHVRGDKSVQYGVVRKVLEKIHDAGAQNVGMGTGGAEVMAFGGSGSGGIRSDINITPLVDVVLVLLIIFMVMTPTLLKQMELTVPEKADVQIRRRRRRIRSWSA